MNKKFTYIFFAFALIFCMFGSVLAQDDGRSSEGGISQRPRGTSAHSDDARLRPGDVRNKLAPLLPVDIGGAVGALAETIDLGNLPPDRVFTITSAGLGIPLQEIQADFTNTQLPLGEFITAEIIADTAGVPVEPIVEEMEEGHDVNEICMELGISTKVLAMILANFLNVCNAEINGTQFDAAAMVNIFDQLLRRTDNNIDLLAIRLGNSTFNAILNERLAFETGFPLARIQELRSVLSTTITPSQFVVSVLVATSVNAVTPTAIDLSSNFFVNNQLFVPARIVTALGATSIPAIVVAGRVDFFRRTMGSISMVG